MSRTPDPSEDRNPSAGSSGAPGASPAAPAEELRAESGELSYSALGLPVVSAVLILSLVFFFFGGDATLELFTTAIATATVAGKFIVLRGLHEQGFLDSPYKLALLVVYMDLLVASIAVYNIGVLYRIPRFGKKIEAMQESGRRILGRNPWMRKVTFLGIIAFVMFPLSGTGAIGGSLFGRLLGLSRVRTMVGIAIGALVGAFGMAALARLFGDQMQNLQGSPVFVIGGLLVIALVVWRLVRNARRAAQRRREQEATPAEGASEDPDPKPSPEIETATAVTAAGSGIATRPRNARRPGRRS